MSEGQCTYPNVMPHQFELNERSEFIDCSEDCAKLFGVPRGCIADHRLDEFVDMSSGSVMLLALLSAYRGQKVKDVPLVINSLDGRRSMVLMAFAAVMHPETEHVTKLIGEFRIYSGRRRTGA